MAQVRWRRRIGLGHAGARFDRARNPAGGWSHRAQRVNSAADPTKRALSASRLIVAAQKLMVHCPSSAIFDGARNRRDGYSVDRSDVGCLEVAAVSSVQLAPGRTRMVVAQDGEMDARQVHVSEGHESAKADSCEITYAPKSTTLRLRIVVLSPRPAHGHPVHLGRHAQDVRAPLEPELRRVDMMSRASHVARRQPRRNVPDSHVRNRIN